MNIDSLAMLAVVIAQRVRYQSLISVESKTPHNPQIARLVVGVHQLEVFVKVVFGESGRDDRTSRTAHKFLILFAGGLTCSVLTRIANRKD